MSGPFIQFNDWYPSIGANRSQVWDMCEAEEQAEHYVREGMASYVESGAPPVGHEGLDGLGLEELKQAAEGLTVTSTGARGRAVKADYVRAILAHQSTEEE